MQSCPRGGGRLRSCNVAAIHEDGTCTIYAPYDMDRDDFVLKTDAYGYHSMNLIDYLVGNTDRHWGNWGLLVDNNTNKLTKLHPLMDFNKSFLAYDTLDGARCLTCSTMKSQRTTAIEAVQAIGLNQIAEVKKEWFEIRLG